MGEIDTKHKGRLAVRCWGWDADKWIVSVLAFIIRTRTVKPCLHDEVIDGLGVDDASETRGIEVPCPGVESDTLQIDASFNRGESHIT